MYKISATTLALIIVTIFFMTACFASEKNMGVQHDNHKSVGTQSITFNKNKLIEIAYISVKKDKQVQFSKQYFPKVMPLVKEYNAKMLARFAVTKKTGGEINPEMIAIFEWPNLAAKVRFGNDQRYNKIKPVRDDALSFMKLGYYQVPKDVTVNFREDKTYEFFGAWLNPNAKDKLDEYFKVSGPIKNSYGRPAPVFKASFSMIEGALKNENTYAPDMAGIVEWDKGEDYFILMDNKNFKKNAAPLMADALSRIDMLHAKLIIK